MATESGGVYFPVDSGFCDTTVARQIVRRLGGDGFLAYVRLLCSMLNEPDGHLPLNTADEWDDLSTRLAMGDEDTRELIALMQHYGMLVRDGAHVWSPLVSSSIKARDEIKSSRSEGGRKSAEARRRKRAERERAKQSAEQSAELSAELSAEQSAEQSA